MDTQYTTDLLWLTINVAGELVESPFVPHRRVSGLYEFSICFINGYNIDYLQLPVDPGRHGRYFRLSLRSPRLSSSRALGS